MPTGCQQRDGENPVEVPGRLLSPGSIGQTHNSASAMRDKTTVSSMLCDNTTSLRYIYMIHRLRQKTQPTSAQTLQPLGCGVLRFRCPTPSWVDTTAPTKPSTEASMMSLWTRCASRRPVLVLQPITFFGCYPRSRVTWTACMSLPWLPSFARFISLEISNAKVPRARQKQGSLEMDICSHNCSNRDNLALLRIS